MSLTFVEIQSNFSAATTNPVTLTNAVAVGDLLLAIILSYSPASNELVTLSVADTVNTGSYNNPAALIFYAGSSTPSLAMQWLKCNAAGIPTITLSGNANGDGMTLAVAHYLASNKNPTLVTADITQNSGSSAAPTATGFTNSATNELIVLAGINGGSATFSSPTGGFTSRLSNAGNYIGELIQGTIGNSITWGASIGSTTWAVMPAGFQDSSSNPNTAPLAWIT